MRLLQDMMSRKLPRMAAAPLELPARAPRGRPRSEQARRAILAAALELVRDEGYRAVTIESVAKRAGVARTTIYRWWPSVAALLVDVLMELSNVVAPPPTGDDPLRAIRLEMRRIAAAMPELPGRVLSALMGEAQHDPRIRAELLDRLIYPRREASARAIRDAQARGLLRDDVSPYVATDLFYGPIFYRMLAGHEPTTERFATQVFERVRDGLAPSADKKEKRKNS
jgi:AcrR family transcriptional regulator